MKSEPCNGSMFTCACTWCRTFAMVWRGTHEVKIDRSTRTLTGQALRDAQRTALLEADERASAAAKVARQG